jgi:DnaJ-class molecular chaperone
VTRAQQGEPFRDIERADDFGQFALTDFLESCGFSLKEVFDRSWRDFELSPRPRSARLENLTFEVVVSVDDARRGGRVQIVIPGRARCAACGGRGGIGFHGCWRCAGSGAAVADYPVTVDYPPGVPDRYAVRIPLSRFGVRNVDLILLFRIGTYAH